MDVKAGYDVDSQKAKDLNQLNKLLNVPQVFLENSEIEKMQTEFFFWMVMLIFKIVDDWF